jgi:hypothetical protein
MEIISHAVAVLSLVVLQFLAVDKVLHQSALRRQGINCLVGFFPPLLLQPIACESRASGKAEILTNQLTGLTNTNKSRRTRRYGEGITTSARSSTARAKSPA